MRVWDHPTLILTEQRGVQETWRVGSRALLEDFMLAEAAARSLPGKGTPIHRDERPRREVCTRSEWKDHSPGSFDPPLRITVIKTFEQLIDNFQGLKI